MEHHSQTPNSDITPKIYGQRWRMLIIYSFTSLLNAAMWMSFATIFDATGVYYDVSTDAVNWLATVFQAIYFPGSIFALYIVKAYNLKQALVVAATGNTAAVILRVLSITFPTNGGFWLCLLGQISASMSQPLILALPAKVAAAWFPADERDSAVTISTMANLVGAALGQVISPMVVTLDDDGKHVTGMSMMLIGQGLLTLISTLSVVFAFESRPPTPPNWGQVLLINSENAHERMEKSFAENLKELYKDNVDLMKDGDFCNLLFAMTIALALFNSLLTVLNQWVFFYGYDDDDAGYFGAVIIGAGLVGAGVAAFAMDTYKVYRQVLKAAFVGVLGAIILVTLSMKPNNGGVLLIGFALFGFFALPILPAVIENAVELTYPTPEETSTVILFCGGNVFGIFTTLGLSQLVKMSKASQPFPEPFTMTNIVLVGSVVVCTFAVLFYNGSYKRLEKEKETENEAMRRNLQEPLLDEISGTTKELDEGPVVVTSPVILVK